MSFWIRLACRAACLCGLGLAVIGCEVGPNFHSPPVSMPAGWVGPTSAPTSGPAHADLVHWWTAFNDPTLNSLVERAVAGNLNLLQAQSRIRQARAQRGVSVGQLFPVIGANAQYTHSRTPTGATKGPTGVEKDFYQAGFDATWELDVFGGLRRNVEAATADVQASIEDWRNTMVTLVGDVALNYVQLRGAQQEIVIAKENLQAQLHNVGITRQRYQAGFVGGLDVANAEAQAASTAASIPIFETTARQSIYSLSVLLGRPPGELVAELSPTQKIPFSPPEVPLGLPSELLCRRPDIRQARALAHAATARIGVASADLFPKFFITGNFGFQDSVVRSWFDWRNRFGAIGPSVSWTLFDGGQILCNIEIQRALTEQAVITYEQTILNALQDVENALIAYDQELQRNQALKDAVAANRRAVDFATQLYTNGQTEFLNVLVTQQSLLNSQDALVQSTRNLSTNMVSLYKALGGGWDINTCPPTNCCKGPFCGGLVQGLRTALGEPDPCPSLPSTCPAGGQ